MEKEMFAVVAIYKSEAVDYLNKKGIAREDALIINTVEDFEEAKNKLIKDVHFISAPMGIASNEDDLKKLLVTTREKEVNALLEELRETLSTDTSNEEEVKEIRETPVSVEDATKSLQEKVDDTANDSKEEAILNEKIPLLAGAISEEDSKEAAKMLKEEVLPKREVVEDKAEKNEVEENLSETISEKLEAIKNLPKRETIEPKVEAPEIKKPAAKKPVTRKKKITKE